MADERITTDLATKLRGLVPASYGDGAGISTRAGLLRQAADEIERLRRFAQYVADFSNDPLIVQEALRHVR